MKKFFLFDPKLLFYGFFIVFFASYGQTFFISLFNQNIREHYNITDGEFGFVYAIATTLSSLMLVMFAKLIDFIEDLKQHEDQFYENVTSSFDRIDAQTEEQRSHFVLTVDVESGDTEEWHWVDNDILAIFKGIRVK